MVMDVGALRRHHLSLILEHLLAHGPRSRVGLATGTGLTKASVSNLVSDLLERGLVQELDAEPGGRVGRPARDVMVVGSSVAGLGLEIDVDHVAAAIVDLHGHEPVRYRTARDNRTATAGQALAALRPLAARALRDAATSGIRCVGATLALPGLVDPAGGQLYIAPNLPRFQLPAGVAEARLQLPGGIPLRTDNEADLGALAELHFGAGREHASYVYVSAGIGIGAGIVVDGRLVRGAHGFAGELGHIVVDPNGRRCGCGARGCLETVIGTRAASSASADALADALRSVVHVLDPEAVVLGGRFAGWGAGFAESVEARLRERTLGSAWHPCRVRPSRFGSDAALVGAAAAALSRVLDDPTIVPRSGQAQQRRPSQEPTVPARRRSRLRASPGTGAPA